MKKIILSLFLLTSTFGFSQITFNAFDASSTTFFTTMYSHLQIKANNSLIFGNRNTSALNAQNGRLKIFASVNLGHSFIDYDHNLYFRSTNGIHKSFALYGDGMVGVNVGLSYTPNALHSLSSKGYKLLVDGSILCEKVKIIGDVPHSDYVFEKSYKLRSLKELATFITSNKHLPEVPSAQEFKENGYSVGQMDDVLLRKIEELTLYVIELQKQIDELKKK